MAPVTPEADGGAPVLVRVLGPLEVCVSRPAESMPTRLRRLLAGLVVCAGSVVSTDRLADVVWGDGEAPANADAALQNLVSRLRSRLRPAAGRVEVLHRPPGYLLSVSPASLDASRFEQLALAGRQALDAAPHAAADLLAEALELWRGPAYAEFADEDFARPEAVRLQELRRAALEDRAEAALRLGHHHEVTAQLEALIRAEPLRERPHRQLVLAQYRAGRHADALAVARAHRARLADELGIDPSPEMQQLESDVLRQDPALRWQPPSVAQPVPVHPTRAASSVRGEPQRPMRARGPLGRPLRLLGRDEDLAEVRDLLLPGSLLTLTGPGGVGKTSLALRLASELGTGFADGVAVAELATLSAPEEVAPAVLTVLGVQPRQEVEPGDRLVEYLRSRELLLVLDNCEHVVEAAAALAHALHLGCPAVALLATSRCPLEAPDERVWTVRPLSLPPAAAVDPVTVMQSPSARLFTERATARSRTFALDNGNAADVAEVCRRLDGLPLAIELAAARMSSLSPAELKDRLTWRFRLLHGGARTAAGRHRTLRAVVDWSYDLLDEPSRRTFEVLSVFAGTFSLADAERLVLEVSDPAGSPDADGMGRAVASDVTRDTASDGASDTACLVLSLVDRSMLTVAVREPHTRYALLDTLRAYGRERLEAGGNGERVRRAHAELYAQLAEEADTHLYQPGHVAAVQRLTAAIDELRAAASWAVEHDLTLAARLVGAMAIYVEHLIPAEVPQWAERTITASATNETAVPGLAKVFGVAAAGARFAGNLDRASELALAGLAIETDPATEGYLRYLLAEVACFQGRLDEMLVLLGEVATLAPTVPVAPIVALMEPLAMMYRGDPEVAQRRASALLAEAHQAWAEVPLAWATYIYGEVLLDTDPARAIDLLVEALHAARRVGDRYLTGVTLTAAAAVRSRHGDLREAAQLFGDALAHWRQAGDWTHQWTTLRNVVDLLVRLGRNEDAAVLHGAMTGREDAPTYGADAARMRHAADQLEARLGRDVATQLCSQGRRLTDDEVVAAATGFVQSATLVENAAPAGE